MIKRDCVICAQVVGRFSVIDHPILLDKFIRCESLFMDNHVETLQRKIKQ